MNPVREASDSELVRRRYDQRRSGRPRLVRAKTINPNRLSKHELEIGRLLNPETDHQKPRTRGECVDGPRPCPFVSCAHHLFLDVSPSTGAIKLNFPDLEVDEMKETCVLDVADRGIATLEDVGEILNLTREGVRLIEARAIVLLKEDPVCRDLGTQVGDIEPCAPDADEVPEHGEGAAEIEESWTW